MGHTTTFDYDANGITLAHSSDVLSTGDPTVGRSFCAGEAVGQPAISGPTEVCQTGPVDTTVVRTLYNGPKLGRLDTTAFAINQFGAPTRIVDSTGTATSIERLDSRFPLLATHVQRLSGTRVLSDQVSAYIDRGLPARVTVLVDTASSLYATTEYTWHPVFDKIARAVDALGEVTAAAYDALGRRVADTAGANPATQRVTRYLYTTAGDEVDSVIAPSVGGQPSTTQLTYATSGNLTTTTTPLGFSTTILRDGIGQDTGSTTPIDAAKTKFRVTTIRRDILGRDSVNITTGPEISPFSQTYSATLDSVIVTTSYDRESRPIEVVRQVNPNPNNLLATGYDSTIRRGRPSGSRS